MANHRPSTPPLTSEIDKLHITYYKNTNGKYWFECISAEQIEEKKTAWTDFISVSMADYYTIVKNQGHTPEKHSEFIDYITRAALFLTQYDLNITLPVNS